MPSGNPQPLSEQLSNLVRDIQSQREAMIRHCIANNIPVPFWKILMNKKDYSLLIEALQNRQIIMDGSIDLDALQIVTDDCVPEGTLFSVNMERLECPGLG